MGAESNRSASLATWLASFINGRESAWKQQVAGQPASERAESGAESSVSCGWLAMCSSDTRRRQTERLAGSTACATPRSSAPSPPPRLPSSRREVGHTGAQLVSPDSLGRRLCQRARVETLAGAWARALSSPVAPKIPHVVAIGLACVSHLGCPVWV